jgi:hypothetical protein
MFGCPGQVHRAFFGNCGRSRELRGGHEGER